MKSGILLTNVYTNANLPCVRTYTRYIYYIHILNYMHTYTPKTFALKNLEGLSEKQISVHLGLYEGYVKNINLLRAQIHDLKSLDAEKYAYAIMEI